MDGGIFDRLTRLLASRLTRRSGLAAAALSLPAVAAARQPHGGARNGNSDSDSDSNGNSKGRGRGPQQEGPCGDGRRKGNICTKDSQCCTGYCEVSLGKKNVDRKGRCRCIRRGKPCTPKQTCCGKAACVDGVCGATAPPPPACQETGGTCATDADCCSCLTCVSGACAACVPLVCASGCDYTTVGDAYAAASAGDTIYIGPGTYPTAITIDKDITLAACPCATGVTLTVDRTVASPDSYYAILRDDAGDASAYAVTLRNLTLEGTYPTDSYDILLQSTFQEKTDWTLEDCTLKNAYYGLWAPTGHVVITRGTVEKCFIGINAQYEDGEEPSSLVMTDVTVSGCDSYGVLFDPWDDTAGTFSTVTGCTFRDNPGYGLCLTGDFGVPPTVITTVSNSTFTGNGGGTYQGLYLYGGLATVTGCTITGNTGGGVFLYDAETTIIDTEIKSNGGEEGAGIDLLAHNRTVTTLTLDGTTMVSNNTASANGGGISRSRQNGSVNYTVVGAGPRVTGNTPDQCYDANSYTVVDCATWV